MPAVRLLLITICVNRQIRTLVLWRITPGLKGKFQDRPLLDRPLLDRPLPRLRAARSLLLLVVRSLLLLVVRSQTQKLSSFVRK